LFDINKQIEFYSYFWTNEYLVLFYLNLIDQLDVFLTKMLHVGLNTFPFN